jgi:hypothetical protein
MITRYTLSIFSLLLLLLPGSLVTKAAGSGLGVTLINYTLDTSNNDVALGYTITINAEVTNFDSLPFNGFINFGLHNNTQILTNTGVFDKPPYSGDSISLGGNETVPAIFSITINQPYFKPGPDVVVVWPICTRQIVDSIIIHLNIVDPSGLSDEKEIPFSYAVVNNSILLKTADAKINFKQVRIYNDLGQKLQEITSDFITEIPLPQLPLGIYFCQLSTADGRRATIKFIAPAK